MKKRVSLLACFAISASSTISFAKGDLQNDLAHLAVSNEFRSYSYSSPTGEKPVISLDNKKVIPEFQKILENETVSFLYRRNTFHAYIRVGDTVFDMWGRGNGEKLPEVHVRNYKTLMNGSSDNMWHEAIVKVDKADRETIQQFYFYRSAQIEMHREAFKKSSSFTTAWSRDFVDLGKPPFIGKENCTGFALSVFNPVFFEENPTIEELKKIHPKAKALAASVGSSASFVEPEKFLTAVKKIHSKYKIPLVSAPPGLMRIVNNHERGAGFIIHNFKKNQDFFRKNSMNFEAKYGVKEPLDAGFDKSIRARTDLKESSLLTAPSCKKALKNISK
jgi:hypothetical protein